MPKIKARFHFLCVAGVCASALCATDAGAQDVPTLPQLIERGRQLFVTTWTSAHGGGTHNLAPVNGIGIIATPTVSSCAGCHNHPRTGGAGEVVTNVIVTGAGPGKSRRTPVRGAIVNASMTTGMFGAGYVEMLARQITADLQALRDAIPAGGKARLVSKGVSFGILSRTPVGAWDTSQVEGLPETSTFSNDAKQPPSLIVQPFHQVGAVTSLREFTINALDFHHGIQAVERFDSNTDVDHDGIVNEINRADVTALVIFQATLPVPGRVIPRDPTVENEVRAGEQLFQQIGCAHCHVPQLVLDKNGWVFVEPGPFDGDISTATPPERVLQIDLRDDALPRPRLVLQQGVMRVPLYSDFKLHDITSGRDDPNRDALNMHTEMGSEKFFRGTTRFLTRRLWGVASAPRYFHNGRYTTLRAAVLAHAGDARDGARKFKALSKAEQDAVITFLESLRILPADTDAVVIDENGKPRPW